MSDYHIPPRVSLAARIKPAVRKELERLAVREGKRLSSYAAAVLEAHCNGWVYCKACGYPHPIPHSVASGAS